jgi:hypothetical protein
MYCTLDCAGRHHDTAHFQIKNQKMRCWTGSDPPSSAHATFITNCIPWKCYDVLAELVRSSKLHLTITQLPGAARLAGFFVNNLSPGSAEWQTWSIRHIQRQL